MVFADVSICKSSFPYVQEFYSLCFKGFAGSGKFCVRVDYINCKRKVLKTNLFFVVWITYVNIAQAIDISQLI